jgi:hypothetical protein
MASQDKHCSSRLASIRSPQLPVGHSACRMRSPLSKKLHSLPLSIGRIIQPRGWRVLAFSAGGDGGRKSPETSPLIDLMPIQKVRFWDPEHWRFRAEEARTVADEMTHEESRTIMRRVAMDYDRLAKLAEQQLADQAAIGRKT